MSETEAIIGKLENLLKDCEAKLSKIELRLPDCGETKEDMSRRVAKLLEPSPNSAKTSVGLQAPPKLVEKINAVPVAILADIKPHQAKPANVNSSAQSPIPPIIKEAGQILKKQPSSTSQMIPQSLGKSLIGIVIAALVISMFWIAHGLEAKHESYALPANSLMGLALGPKGLLSMDISHGAAAALDLRHGIVRISDLRSIIIPETGALAWGDDGLWVADGGNSILYRYDGLSGDSKPQAYFQSDRHPVLASIIQDRLWTVDKAGKRIDKYLISQALTGASLALMGSYPLPDGIVPAGIYESNGEIWLLDAAALRIWRYDDSSAALKALSFFDLKPWLGSQARLEGLAVNASEVWTMDISNHVVHRFRRSAVSWESPAAATSH